MKCSLGISNFLEEISSLSHSIVFLYSLHWSPKKAFLSPLAILWNSVFKWVYLFFSPLHLASLLFSTICKGLLRQAFCLENTLVIANTFFHKYKRRLHMVITRWSILKSDWLILCKQRWRSSIQSAKTRLGVDCGSDHELLIAKFRLKLKKVGETTRPFMYYLNQIP